MYLKIKERKLALKDDDWPRDRCHKHAMLLMTKRLLLNLWCVWNPKLVKPYSAQADNGVESNPTMPALS